MFEQYKQIKIIKQGGNSLKVILLKNREGHKIIMKQYDRHNSSHVVSFNKEIKILTILEFYKYVPKLLHIDHNECTFYESYCGTVIPKDYPNYDKKIMERTKDLYDLYGLEYIKNNERKWILYWKNYCILDGDIYMIDFGSNRWKESHKKIEI